MSLQQYVTIMALMKNIPPYWFTLWLFYIHP